MTPATALELLGLTPPADRAAVRAAYLRLLRVTKPEQKPAEFRQLREAYELVQEGWSGDVDDDGDLEDGDLEDDDLEGSDSSAPSARLDPESLAAALAAMERDLAPGLERIRALEDLLYWLPEPSALALERLFLEYRHLDLQGHASSVLEDLRKVDPLRAFTLNVRELPEHTTTYALKFPPEGAALEDRLTALEILAERHRQWGEVTAFALKLAAELTPEARAKLGRRLVVLGLRVGASGFVDDGRALLDAVLTHTGPEDTTDRAAREWAAQKELPNILSAAIAGAILHDDTSFVGDVLDRVPEPRAAKARLEAEAPELARRFGALLDRPASSVSRRRDELVTRAPTIAEALRAGTREPGSQPQEPNWALMSVLGLILILVGKACGAH